MKVVPEKTEEFSKKRDAKAVCRKLPSLFLNRTPGDADSSVYLFPSRSHLSRHHWGNRKRRTPTLNLLRQC